MKLKNKTDTDLQVCYGEQKVKLFPNDEAEIMYNSDVSEFVVSECYEKMNLKEMLFGLLLGSFLATLAGEQIPPMSECFKFPVRFKTDGSNVTLVKSHRLYEICALNVAETEENGTPIITKEGIEQQKKRYYFELLAQIFLPLVILLGVAVAAFIKQDFKAAVAFAITLVLALVFVFLLPKVTKQNKQTLEKLNKMVN